MMCPQIDCEIRQKGLFVPIKVHSIGAPHVKALVLSGGAGNDRLWGDGEAASDAAEVVGGADRFVFGSGSDRDTVLDFEDNKDAIDVRGFRGIDRFAEVRAWATQADADTVIDLGAASGAAAHADVLTLAGFDLTRLNAADFAFA